MMKEASNPQLDSTPSPQPEEVDDKKHRLRFIHKLGFGLGHIYNDLCAGVWFGYTLLFMSRALELASASTLIMIGQVSDAIATPIIGILADKFGTKRQWHMFGTGLIFVTFPMIFSLCPWCDTGPDWWPILYFSIFIIIFQFAWAVVQISHLSIIPEMSMSTKDRENLTSTTYSGLVIANIIVYVTAWGVLKQQKYDKNIGPADVFRFRDISLILTSIGIITSITFHFSLYMSGYEQRRLLIAANLAVDKKKSLTISDIEVVNERRKSCNPDDTQKFEKNNEFSSQASIIPRSDNNLIKRKNFFKSPRFYQNALLYVCSRLFMTTSLLYMTMWLDELSRKSERISLNDNNNVDDTTHESNEGNANVEHLATVPLVSFIASFVASIGLKHVNRWMGHQLAYFIGTIISIIGCVWVATLPLNFGSYILYCIAVLFGAGSCITMYSSMFITADMVGQHTYQGGLIYSVVTFADKLITGIVVKIIGSLECENLADCPVFYRNVLSYGCGTAAALGILTLSTLICTKRLKKVNK